MKLIFQSLSTQIWLYNILEFQKNLSRSKFSEFSIFGSSINEYCFYLVQIYMNYRSKSDDSNAPSQAQIHHLLVVLVPLAGVFIQKMQGVCSLSFQKSKKRQKFRTRRLQYISPFSDLLLLNLQLLPADSSFISKCISGTRIRPTKYSWSLSACVFLCLAIGTTRTIRNEAGCYASVYSIVG